MASIEAVGAREILDSRGNPTVEVEVAPRRRHGRPRRGALAVPPPVPSRRSSCATAATATAARASQKAVDARRSTRSARSSIGFDANDQRLVDQAMLDLDGTPNKAKLGANAILGVSLAVARAAADSRRPAAVPLRRRPQRPPAAGADDEHPQRRRARRLQRRHPGVHDRADRRADLPRGAAAGRRGLPRAQVGAEEEGPGHRARRRGRLRARPRRPTAPRST